MKRFKTPTITIAFLGMALSFTGIHSPVEAGTVFMKNGYIIQGPVIKQEEDSIVLGWDHGKMTIHRRFYQTVVLTSEEKANLERIRQEELANEQESLEDSEVVFQGEDGYEQLPDSFNEIVEKLNLPFAGASKLNLDDENDPSENSEDVTTTIVTGENLDDVNDPSTGDEETSHVEVTEIDPPVVVSLADRVQLEALGISFQGPSNWEFEQGEGYSRWVGGTQSDGFQPNVIVLTSQIEGFTLETALKSTQKVLKGNLEDFTFTREDSLSLDGREGYLFSGTGSYQKGENSLEVKITQVILASENQFWLSCSFSSAQTDPELALLLEKSVQSIEWLATEDSTPVESSEETEEFTSEESEVVEEAIEEVVEEETEETIDVLLEDGEEE